MKKSRYSEEQIIGFLKQADTGMPIKELCRKGGDTLRVYALSPVLDGPAHRFRSAIRIGAPSAHPACNEDVEAL